MIIAVDIRPLLEKQYSGVGEYCFRILNSLFIIDKHNRYILFYNTYKSVDLPQWDNENVEYCGFSYPNKLLNTAFFIMKYPFVDKIIANKIGVSPDIFWLTNHNFISLSDECKLVTTIHDLSFVHFPYFFTLKNRLWHKMVNTKKLVQNSEHIIAVSKHTSLDLVNTYNISSDKISVIPLGVAEDFRSIDLDKLYKVSDKYKLPKTFILSLSTLEPRKNILSVIEAFISLKSQGFSDIHLVLVGKKVAQTSKIKALIQNSEYKDYIHQVGYIDKEDKPFVYSLADLFVYPSFYEGFGLPPLEASMVGTPVITSFTSSLSEMNSTSALLVDPYNVDQLSRAMSSVLSDEQLRAKLVANGQQNAVDYTWERSAQQTLSVLERLGSC